MQTTDVQQGYLTHIGISLNAVRFIFCRVIQEERSRVLGGDIIGHCEEKVHMTMCLILKGYRDRAVWISRPNSIRFLFVGLDERRSVLKKGGYSRRIALSQYGCCCQHNGTWRPTQTNNSRSSSHASCKVHWGWPWVFGTSILYCNKFVIFM